MEFTRNVGKLHPVDEFHCEKCQIHLEDWIRHEVSEDGDIMYWEYAFKYCPNCGRKVVEQ